MDFGIAGKSALVLGSTSGLGRAIAVALASERAHVAFVGRRFERARDLAAQHPGAHALECDLTQPDSAQRLVAEATERLGTIEILVLNSGGPAPGGAVGLSPGEVTRAVETMLIRQLEFVEALLPAMRARGWGRILAVGSTSVQAPLPGLALSNIARSGLAGYLKTLAGEVAADGVTVNMVLPGRIVTDRLSALDERRASDAGTDVVEVRRRAEALIPLGRYGTPEEFAAVAAFLCSAQASYVTGEQVRCDGGMVPAF